LLVNTDKAYGSVAIFFHWLSALIVIALIIVGYIMQDISGPIRSNLYMYHKSFGSLILLVAVCRYLWRLINIVPKLPNVISKMVQNLAHTVHLFFYSLLILMPVSGLCMTFFSGRTLNLFNIYKIKLDIAKDYSVVSFSHDSHEILSYLFIGLIIIHSSAALWHQFGQKINILARMLPLKHFNKKDRI
jgi:cytochrome b561